MIHNTSVIDKKAKISDSVKIGPFCYVGPNVELSDGVELVSNVHIEGFTKLEKEQKFFHLLVSELNHKILNLKMKKQPYL